ncbi:MAG: methionine--tRNA ligase, partial [Bacteroidota bacterium]
MSRLLVTSALPYVNGPIHIGHLAGAYLPADLFVRYQRLKGRDVVYICGSDEHGVAILIRAMQEGVEPQAIIDRYHAQVEEDFARFGMSFDYYGRTSAPVHHATSQAMFATLDRAGVFTTRTSEQLFDPEANLFLADRFVRGTCPVCGYEEAYGDQCENCGSSLSPDELIDPRSALSGATPIRKETTHWYLPLGDLQPQLEAWVATKTGWKANVQGQIKSWLNDGLADRAMTRDLPWGVAVPDSGHGDANDPTREGKVLYVWFDAPIGYVSATKAWAKEQGTPERWRDYWQRDDTDLVHFIGKDNIVFHTLIFPAILMAYNAAVRQESGQAAEDGAPQFVLPANVPANEFLNLEGQKLSTSRGWAVWVHEALDAFPADVLRYALATMLPESKDADFSWGDFQERVNSELADVLGNFVNRTLSFAHRFAGGTVPPLREPSETDRDALDQLATFPKRVGEAYEAYRMREAVQATMALARLGNKYFNDTEPWKTRKTDERACMNTIHVSLQLCASLSVLMEPIVPEAAARLRAMLRLEGVRSSAPGQPGGDFVGWDEAGTPLLREGHALGEAAILFAKIEDEAIEAQRTLLEERAAERAAEASEDATPEVEAEDEAPYAPAKPTVTFDDFSKLDLRTGIVAVAEPHPNADKLLRLEVDLGYETRQVLAGVAEHYAPADLIGARVVLVANLAPRKIRGLESQGMVLMAEDRAGRLVPVRA